MNKQQNDFICTVYCIVLLSWVKKQGDICTGSVLSISPLCISRQIPNETNYQSSDRRRKLLSKTARRAPTARPEDPPALSQNRLCHLRRKLCPSLSFIASLSPTHERDIHYFKFGGKNIVSYIYHLSMEKVSHLFPLFHRKAKNFFFHTP